MSIKTSSTNAHLQRATPTPLRKAGLHSIESHIAGNLWQVQVCEGERVNAGDVLVVLESMKMEIPLCAPRAGVIREVRVQPGSAVRAGQRVVVLAED